MQIFVGLGNPGPNYANHRHNIGFSILNQIANDYNFIPWRSKFHGQISEGKLDSIKILLLKPQTFMNNSGQSVNEVMRFFKLTPDHVTVFHDELDLPLGKLRYKTGGGHAGHNGLKSIHSHIGNTYHRIRIGIGHPGHKDLVSRYVLSEFKKTDQEFLGELINAISKAVPKLAEGNSSNFLNFLSQHKINKVSRNEN
ncbi:MAG: aminoacyl-tRNA hydrolase [Aestuariivita sp.]|nr:aminoacyl-tRNA hydrolase [Aestuariivita sp.]